MSNAHSPLAQRGRDYVECRTMVNRIVFWAEWVLVASLAFGIGWLTAWVMGGTE